MNERIKELITEAVNFRLDPDSNAYEAQICPEDLEYLAALIVQECAKSVNDWYQNHDKIHCDPMSYVLAHFGVEE